MLLEKRRCYTGAIEPCGEREPMESCKIDNPMGTPSFKDLYEDMQTDAYWIRFFVRPCCPAPALDGAIEMLDKLSGEVMAQEGFTDEQKQQLASLIEARKDWYPASGLCKKG